MVETKFKHTDIGLIPEDWKIVNWNDVFDFKSTASYSRANLQKQGEIGYIHYGDIHTKINALLDTNKFVSGYISNSQIKSYPTINEGDLVMADASEDYSGVGKGFEVINKPNIPVISGLHTFLVREKDKGTFAKGFKGYFYHNPLIKSQYDSLATGLKVYSLSKNSFQNIQIPLPLLSEQQAIAEVLSDTDAWIESLEKLIAKKQLIKQGAMQQLLTPKEDWEVKRLGEILTFGSGKDYKHLKKGNIPVYGTGGLMTYVDLYLYDGDSIGIGRKGTIDQPIFLNGRFWTVDTLFYTYDFIECLPKYIYYQFLQIEWKNYNEASGVPSLNKNTLEQIEIQLPSLTEQTHIATILSDMDTEIEALAQKLAKARQMKQGLMQELLTGRTRIVVNN